MKILGLLLAVTVTVFGAFIVITKSFALLPYFVLILGIFILYTAVRDIRNKEKEFGAYMNLTIFGVILVYFLFISTRS